VSFRNSLVRDVPDSVRESRFMEDPMSTGQFAFRGLPLALILLMFALPIQAQTAKSAYPKAWQAFNGGNPVHSISITADAHFIAGSDDETGTAQLNANADGSYTVELSLPSGSRNEAQTSFSSGQVGTWAGSDGIVKQTAFQNSLLPAAWFMPGAAMFGGQQPTSVTTVVADTSLTQTNNPQGTPGPAIAALYNHVSTITLTYDPATNLPLSMSYTIHPDNAASQDLRFSGS
jgi:hypothetical protein